MMFLNWRGLGNEKYFIEQEPKLDRKTLIKELKENDIPMLNLHRQRVYESDKR